MTQTEQMKQAIENGDGAAVRELLAQGCEADAQYEMINHDGFAVSYTALMQAADAGEEKIALLLLDAGANTALESASGDTALFAAAGRGDYGTLTALVKAGADVNYANRDGWTALMAASRGGQTEAVQALLAAGADVNARDRRGNTALTAAKAGQKETLQALIAAGAELPTGEDLAHWRLSLGQYFDCHSLADPNYFKAKNEYGETMLVEACKRRDYRQVNEMMRHGANPGLKDKSGRCAADYVDLDNLQLVRAVEAGESASALAAIAQGADVNISYYFAREGGQSAPMTLLQAAAAFECDPAVVQALIEAGADVKAKDADGATALHFAKNQETARLLLQGGANVNARDKDRETPLFAALRLTNSEDGLERHARVCILLIDEGADLHVKNREGRRPLDMVAPDKFPALPPSLAARLLFPKKEAKQEPQK